MFSSDQPWPYRSPIRVDALDRRQEGVFHLSFLNLLYAAGVQQTAYLVRPIRWERTYLAAEQLLGGMPNDRLIVIERLDRRWMEDNVKNLATPLERLFDEDGEPLAVEFLRLVANAC
jgi:hypothetical protein